MSQEGRVVPLRPGPGPDELVWMFNWFCERRKDGSWTVWLEPLGGGQPTLVVTGPTATHARSTFLAALVAKLNEGDEAHEKRYREAHAKPFSAKVIPDCIWPPPKGKYANLGFESSGRYESDF